MSPDQVELIAECSWVQPVGILQRLKRVSRAVGKLSRDGLPAQLCFSVTTFGTSWR